MAGVGDLYSLKRLHRHMPGMTLQVTDELPGLGPVHGVDGVWVARETARNRHHEKATRLDQRREHLEQGRAMLQVLEKIAADDDVPASRDRPSEHRVEEVTDEIDAIGRFEIEVPDLDSPATKRGEHQLVDPGLLDRAEPASRAAHIENPAYHAVNLAYGLSHPGGLADKHRGSLASCDRVTEA
jgi:hypothetical protein